VCRCRRAARRRSRSYTLLHRGSDPRNKYLRRLKGGRWLIRIPLDATGRLRLALGSFPNEEEARFARRKILGSIGVTVDSPPESIHSAARKWLRGAA
jgi:hypothetical protein